MGIKVTFDMDRCGNITAVPVCERYARIFCAVAAINGGPSFKTARRDGFSAFFNDGQETADLRDYFTSTEWKDMEQGYSVTKILDPWEVGHFYGYDAHHAAEAGFSVRRLWSNATPEERVKIWKYCVSG